MKNYLIKFFAVMGTLAGCVFASMPAALSMQAQTLYVLGCGQGLSYYDEEALEVELVDGKYSFDVQDLSDLYVSFNRWSEEGDQLLRYDSYVFELDYADLGTSVKSIKRMYSDTDKFTRLPFEGDYHVEIASNARSATFYARIPQTTYSNDLYYVGPQADSSGHVTRQLQRVSDTEFQLDCSGENRIPAMALFSIVGNGWHDGYGCGVLDGSDCVKLWQFGKHTMLEKDFDGIITVKLNRGLLQPAEVAMTASAGISDIEVAPNTEVKYYNLQGIEVKSPRNGIYVEQSAGGSRLVKK